MKFTKSITYQDKSIFKIIHPIGYWQYNDGNFGSFNCIGWVKNIKDKESLEVNCEALDNEKDKFWVILNRSSEIGAGVGNTTYIDGTGKYKKLINKKYKYSNNSYYSILKLDGTSTNNFSNYGNFNALVNLEIYNSELKQHFFSAELAYQDRSTFYGQGSRTSKEFRQGTDKLLITNANKKIKELIGVKCVYAINFFRSTSFTITKCNITKNQKTALSNISENKE